MTTNRRLIEETFPVKDVSVHAAREKNIRHGHISTLHIWWARRPLAASRATAYAALVPPPADIVDWQRQRDFIVALSKWENSLNERLLKRARREIYAAHAERLSQELGRPVTVADIEAGRVPPPRVLDPFAGGGSYPLEALRLGCEAYANDYNPVAVLILKATLEYPQKYGRPFEGMPEHLWCKDENGRPSARQSRQMALGLGEPAAPDAPPPDFNPLLAAVKYWGDWVLEQARAELAEFYPPAEAAETVVGYIWARTLPCQNPACRAEIPLMRQFWLAKKAKKKVALRIDGTRDRTQMNTDETDEHGFFQKKVRENPSNPSQSASRSPSVSFRIVGDGYEPWPDGFDPSRGTVSRAVVTCPACGAVMDAKTTRRLFREGRAGQRMVAVVTTRQGSRGKFYRLPTKADLAAYAGAEEALAAKRAALRGEWGIEPVPDEPIPTTELRRISVPLFGMDTWGALFNPRQQLALITFADDVRRVHAEMLAKGYPEDFAKVVAMYLGINFDRLVSYCSSLGYWHVSGEKMSPGMQRQALAMVFDYAESVPFAESFSWDTNLEWVIRIIKHLSQIFNLQPLLPAVTHASAARVPYLDNYFDAVLTDPPYYDSVPYSHLADFFYVWLKRTVGNLYPELFATPLIPKGEEIVQDRPHSLSRSTKDKDFFEANLTKAFQEIFRVLKPDGIASVVYAHKSTEGWETVINALLNSGLVVSGAWPLNTEMRSRLNANETAALASSIYIVARKAARQPTGFYNEVRQELRRHLGARLQRLWEEGIGGADFFIAAIGSAIEVFGRYEQVMDYEGNVIRADRLLEEVRTLATDFAVRQILHNGFAGEVSERTRFYVLWRWNYGEARVPFDEARKLAQSCGIDLAQEWARRGSFVKKEREFIRVLGPQMRQIDDLEESRELIDVLHHALRLWEKGDRPALVQRLALAGYGASEAFYRVAQAVSETLPIESKEKKLLDGFLAGRERLRQAVGKAAQQRRLEL